MSYTHECKATLDPQGILRVVVGERPSAYFLTEPANVILSDGSIVSVAYLVKTFEAVRSAQAEAKEAKPAKLKAVDTE